MSESRGRSAGQQGKHFAEENALAYEDGLADYAGFTHGAIQRADGGLGQGRGGANREDAMEHGSNHGAPTEAIYGNGGGVLQGPVDKDEKYAIRGKGLDADDQAKMDELRGPRAAREPRTHDFGGGFVVEPGRKKNEAGRKTNRSIKRTDTLVGRGAGKRARRARRDRIDAGSNRGSKHVERKCGAFCSSGPGEETWEAAGGVNMRTRESLHENTVHATRGSERCMEGRRRMETGSTGAPGQNGTGDNEGVKENRTGIRNLCAGNAIEHAKRSYIRVDNILRTTLANTQGAKSDIELEDKGSGRYFRGAIL